MMKVTYDDGTTARALWVITEGDVYDAITMYGANITIDDELLADVREALCNSTMGEAAQDVLYSMIGNRQIVYQIFDSAVTLLGDVPTWLPTYGVFTSKQAALDLVSRYPGYFDNLEWRIEEMALSDVENPELWESADDVMETPEEYDKEINRA